MKTGNKSGGPIGGLFAALLLFGVVGIGLATGRMPLAGANNLGVELDRWPLVFWAYTGVLAGLGVTVLAWSLRALAKGKNS